MACTPPSSLGGGGENFRKVFARGRSEMFFLMGGNLLGGRVILSGGGGHVNLK